MKSFLIAVLVVISFAFGLAIGMVFPVFGSPDSEVVYVEVDKFHVADCKTYAGLSRLDHDSSIDTERCTYNSRHPNADLIRLNDDGTVYVQQYDGSDILFRDVEEFYRKFGDVK